jgi:RNA polymerase-binding transcription factor DksA
MKYVMLQSRVDGRGDLVDQANAGLEVDVRSGVATILNELDRPLHLEGVCKDCGEPIPAARLRAMPSAIRCCGCESSYEDKYVARKRIPGFAPPHARR